MPHSARQQRGDAVGLTKSGKGSKLLVIVDGNGRPVALHVASARPHEITLLLDLLQQTPAGYAPARLIGDNAYDSDAHDELLWREWDIELIAPHRIAATKRFLRKMAVRCAATRSSACSRWRAIRRCIIWSRR